ncbi:primosomal protein N' [Lactococcus insecticola]|uniref:Replication restart protein PriA n=1 Tax=Pseudolactococcus insecticola TaxID=2709158 RepID=A0A6A0B5R0_9LACT|nr:primosomal protein N' [Lactococcus insecticola]GFH40730.1 primosomal protein N' [Lactococcus insecticola]
MKIAKIIVDVPSMQTDKPFSYVVPEALETLVAIGMRVHVPFGRGNRLMQGFIVGFESQELVENQGNRLQDLKVIAEVLDFEPVLNAEQLALADKMRETVFAYKISILKAMLPNLLNSSYDKVLTALDPQVASDYFENADEIHFSSLDEVMQATMMKLQREGKVSVRYVAQSKETIKTKKVVSLTNHAQLLALTISARAKKKLAMQTFLQHEPEGKVWDNTELVALFSRDVVKFFIGNGVLTLSDVEVSRSQDYFENIETDTQKTLNAEQKAAYEAIITSQDKPFLLEGVTGSGKTEVYLQVIAHVIDAGKTAIMLVPEISLTPMMTSRFIARFGENVAIMHSGLSDGEKYDEWRKIAAGKAKVVVGARSAIFVPLANIGAIIIDEEHETSYKQDSNPRYHARDIALLRAQYHGAALVLGSATPSLETRARAQQGVYQLLRLTQRANQAAQIPEVRLLDMRKHLNDKSASFSQVMLDKIAEKVSKKEQVVLMLNRRGYSSFIMCRDCGFVPECPNCDISLTLHMDTKTLNCHYCGHTQGIPYTCPNCQSNKIRYYGSGTQKVEEELQELMPEARILRMDVDTTKKKGAHERILSSFGAGQADILLGTQMIAKGLDFPNVTLVGVINADTALNLPDFRASERTFQLLTQVAGRAGRAEKSGEVLIQTFNPDHYAIKLAQTHDYEQFYQTEMAFRRKLAYPPYYFTVQLVISHKNEEITVKKSYEILSLLQAHLTDKARVLGPIAKPIARTHNLYHYQLLIKYRFEDHLADALNDVLDLTQLRENKELRVMIDSEPQNFM